jgi:hypothetical protein
VVSWPAISRTVATELTAEHRTADDFGGQLSHLAQRIDLGGRLQAGPAFARLARSVDHDRDEFGQARNMHDGRDDAPPALPPSLTNRPSPSEGSRDLRCAGLLRSKRSLLVLNANWTESGVLHRKTSRASSFIDTKPYSNACSSKAASRLRRPSRTRCHGVGVFGSRSGYGGMKSLNFLDLETTDRLGYDLTARPNSGLKILYQSFHPQGSELRSRQRLRAARGPITS